MVGEQRDEILIRALLQQVGLLSCSELHEAGAVGALTQLIERRQPVPILVAQIDLDGTGGQRIEGDLRYGRRPENPNLPAQRLQTR